MQVSGRARLAWANRNLEAAADIIVADYLRVVARYMGTDYINVAEILDRADDLDPEGES